MPTWPPAVTRPGRHAARTALLLGLVPLLVGLTLMARDPAAVVSATDLDRIEDAVELGCTASTELLDEGTGFALDGTVVDVVVPPGRSPVRVTLRVREWFRGPPLDRVEVWVDPATARRLGDDALAPATGSRLLVSGRGWQGRDDGLLATGCGRTRGWDAETAQDWRQDIGPAASARAAGPAATYPSAGFVRTVTEPDLRGVAVLDSGCLYVQDGRTRWVPVLPSATAAWQDRPASLELDGVVTDVGHMVRLAGLPAGGDVRRGADGTDPSDVVARLVDPAGVPTACDPDAPRFVVAERGVPGPPPAQAGTATSGVASEAARRAGLGVTTAEGRLVTDGFGATSSRVVLRTDDAAEVLVHVESVAFLAWPHAYAPRDARLVRSGDPDHARGLPVVPPGWELAVVSRSDGVTQVLLRTPGRVVVSVTAEMGELGPFPDGGGGTVALQALTDVALDVAALSRDGAVS